MLTLALSTLILTGSPGYGDQPGATYSFSKFEGRIITGIEIVRRDVFDDKVANNSRFYYRWGNSLHIKTKEKIVKDELLFEVGEPFDSLKIIESQRNLRRRGFIGEIFVSARPNGSDSVNLTVTTVDYWTTRVAMYSELGGGNYAVGAAASEVNFLGYGQALEIAGQTGSDKDSYSMYAGDDRIGGSRLAGSLYYTGTTYGNSFATYLARPQYSLTVRTGYWIKYNQSDAVLRLYTGGEEFFRYKRLFREFDSRLTYSMGLSRRLDLFVKYNYDFKDYSPDDPNSPLNHIIPFDETRSYISPGIGMSIIKYDLQRYLDEAGTPEDLTLGAGFRISIGRSLKSLGADFDEIRPEISAKFLVKPYEWIFLGARNKVFWWRRDGRDKEIRSQSEIMMYLKTGRTNVLTARWLADFAWRQKSTYQLILGGTNGLRGYQAYRFAGNRAVIGNLEYRFYLPLEILTVRLGGAAFFDIGNVWRAPEKIEIKDLRSDIGLGLRFGLTKSSTSRVLRFDMAKSLADRDVYVSFGSTVLFSLKSLDSHE